MLIKSFSLLMALGAWLALLWLGIDIDFSRHAPTSVIALHLLPPLSAWTAWLAFRALRERRRADMERLAAQEAEARLQAQQRAEQAEADRQRAERERHIDCRAVSISGLKTAKPVEGLPAAGHDTCHVAWTLAETEPAASPGRLDQLCSLMREALADLRTIEPACLKLPLFVIAPPALTQAAVGSLLQETIATLNGDPGAAHDGKPVVNILCADSADCLASLFENLPVLGAATLLAIDAQETGFADASDEDALLTPDQVPPSPGAFALLLTAPAVEHATGIGETPRASANEADAHLPFWERSRSGSSLPPGAQTLTEPEWRKVLELPVLARIHRPALGDFDTATGGMLAQARRASGLLNEALLNAVAGNGLEQAALVHDAGNIAHCGKRLACLGSALHAAGIDTEPVGSAALNVTDVIGDLGAARQAGLLACAIAMTAASRMPTVSAAFLPRGQAALRFIMPNPG